MRLASGLVRFAAWSRRGTRVEPFAQGGGVTAGLERPLGLLEPEAPADGSRVFFEDGEPDSRVSDIHRKPLDEVLVRR